MEAFPNHHSKSDLKRQHGSLRLLLIENPHPESDPREWINRIFALLHDLDCLLLVHVWNPRTLPFHFGVDTWCRCCFS